MALKPWKTTLFHGEKALNGLFSKANALLQRQDFLLQAIEVSPEAFVHVPEAFKKDSDRGLYRVLGLRNGRFYTCFMHIMLFYVLLMAFSSHLKAASGPGFRVDPSEKAVFGCDWRS